MDDHGITYKSSSEAIDEVRRRTGLTSEDTGKQYASTDSTQLLAQVDRLEKTSDWSEITSIIPQYLQHANAATPGQTANLQLKLANAYQQQGQLSESRKVYALINTDNLADRNQYHYNYATLLSQSTDNKDDLLQAKALCKQLHEDTGPNLYRVPHENMKLMSELCDKLGERQASRFYASYLPPTEEEKKRYGKLGVNDIPGLIIVGTGLVAMGWYLVYLVQNRSDL